MKLLLDTCVWGGAVSELVAAGHEPTWVGDWPQDPGDEQILATANREDRVLVTLDKDFGELAVAYHQPHKGIIRLVGISAAQQGPVCVEILKRYIAELRQSAIITAEQGRIRIRTTPAGTQADDC